MPITFTPPQNAQEVFILAVPFLTALLGLGYLLAPRAMLESSGLEPKPQHPDALGEGRATYAGMLLGFGLCCLLLQEPKALQPGLNQALAFAWLISGIGFVMQIFVDGQRRIGAFVRLFFAFFFAALAWWYSDPLVLGLNLTLEWKGAVLGLISVFTIVLGLIALLLPRLALEIMRLQGSSSTPMCICGPRGMIGGFYVSAGAGSLFVVEPLVAGLWLQVLLGVVWLLTGLGRIVAMVLDPSLLRGFTRYNMLGTVFEISVGLFVLGAVFGAF